MQIKQEGITHTKNEQSPNSPNLSSSKPAHKKPASWWSISKTVNPRALENVGVFKPWLVKPWAIDSLWVRKFRNTGFAQVQIIHFDRVFHYKPSILGYHYFWKHPYIENLDVWEKWLRSHASSNRSRVQGASSCLLLAMVEPKETKIGGTLGLERGKMLFNMIFTYFIFTYFILRICLSASNKLLTQNQPPLLNPYWH